MLMCNRSCIHLSVLEMRRIGRVKLRAKGKVSGKAAMITCSNLITYPGNEIG